MARPEYIEMVEQMALDWTPEPHYYAVGELTTALRGVFAEYFTDIWVAGEISGTKLAPSGHYYFTLKDADAQLKCACYKMTARYLKFKPQDGIAVLVRGRVDLYEARAEVQLIVETIEPQGHGALQLAFEQLKKKLAAQGLFDAARKRALPPFPERIGIVTSPTGAVIQDLLNILERRAPGRHIRLYPAQVQGEGAAEQVAQGIEYFSASDWAEVVVVARGGGSMEDLWTFNEERVARAIADCSVPVVSAVGHETDFTIADFVADLRAPTPSAAAELIVPTQESLIDQISIAEHKLTQSIRLTFALAARALHGVAVDQLRLHQLIGKHAQMIDDQEDFLHEQWRAGMAERATALDAVTVGLSSLDLRLRVADFAYRLDACDAAIAQIVRLRLSRARGELAPLEAHLKQLSPLGILQRGYAIVERDGNVVKSANDAPVGSPITIKFAKTGIDAIVTRARKEGTT
jgi:exodeoxyribonuclease VII large subunit